MTISGEGGERMGDSREGMLCCWGINEVDEMGDPFENTLSGAGVSPDNNGEEEEEVEKSGVPLVELGLDEIEESLLEILDGEPVLLITVPEELFHANGTTGKYGFMFSFCLASSADEDDGEITRPSD